MNKSNLLSVDESETHVNSVDTDQAPRSVKSLVQINKINTV